MAKYTPLHIKKENQYTDGTQFMLMDYSPYTGYYNVTVNGPYTGRVYDDGSSKPLKKLVKFDNDAIKTYLQLADEKSLKTDFKFADPYYVITTPIEEDFQRGYMLRYFIRKRNDISAPIIEIDKDQHDKYESKDEGINPFLYKAISIKWKISGPQNDVYGQGGKLMKAGVEDTNKRTVKSASNTLSEMFSILSNFVEYSKYDQSYRGD